MRKADVRSHPVLWVTAVNVKLPVPFLTSDWVLSKLLLFCAQQNSTSIFHSALSLGECMSWQKMLEIRSLGFCSEVRWTARKNNVKWSWHDWHGVGQEWSPQQRDTEKDVTPWKKYSWTQGGHGDRPSEEDVILQRAVKFCQLRKGNNERESTETEPKHF